MTADDVASQVAHDHGIPLVVDNTFGMGGLSFDLFV
jgi:O-acetylhomoserine/O-acetylserine sulfhydrylase-like pyridoxal-dependent enzyme